MPTPATMAPPPQLRTRSCNLARKESSPGLRPAAIPPLQWFSSTTSPAAPATASRAMLALRRP
eukprot:15457140-Alexandrium_andersonii.AAC.1